VVVAQLTYYLADHLTVGGALGYALMFVTVWWVAMHRGGVGLAVVVGLCTAAML
jgi:hypothetical protein